MQRNQVQAVAESGGGLVMLFIVWDDDEQEEGEAEGHVYRASFSREDDSPPEPMLATSDTLRAMCVSQEGSLWVASADGNVGTTADVRWTRGPMGADYKTLSGPSWHATALSAVRPTGLPPNLDVIWALNDKCVYAHADGGHIYHWNGETWNQVYQGADDGSDDLAAFGGSASNDVYAVGVRETLLHFDGITWTRLRLPPPKVPRENLTGVHVAGDGTVFISSSLSSDEGRLLVGGVSGFSELGHAKFPLISMAVLGERVIFATGRGVAEWVAPDIRSIKDTFNTVAQFPGVERTYFLEPEPDAPGYIEYHPADEAVPWWRFSF